MRIGFIIIGLAAIALGLVSLRREETRLSHELQQIESQKALISRDLWDRKVEVSQLAHPRAIQERATAMSLDMTNDEPTCAMREEEVGLP